PWPLNLEEVQNRVPDEWLEEYSGTVKCYIMNYKPHLEKVTQNIFKNRRLMYFLGYKSKKVTQNISTKIEKVTQTF
ncbi:hypothetical protein LCGC14_2359900, partial [marine sediment metagenome]